MGTHPGGNEPSPCHLPPSWCEAAWRAGVPTVAILTGGFSEQELRDAGAVAVFDSVQTLCRQLDETPLA